MSDLDRMHEEFGKVILISEKVVKEQPLTIHYTFKNTFPYYHTVEKALEKITRKRSVGILEWRNEPATHEMISVDMNTFVIKYEEVQKWIYMKN